MQTYTAAAISLLSDAQYFTVPEQAVTMPRGLTASATQTRVSLKWTAVDDATSYQVFDGTGALLATTTPGVDVRSVRPGDDRGATTSLPPATT